MFQGQRVPWKRGFSFLLVYLIILSKIYFMWVTDLSACMHEHSVPAWCSWKSEEGVGLPGEKEY